MSHKYTHFQYTCFIYKANVICYISSNFKTLCCMFTRTDNVSYNSLLLWQERIKMNVLKRLYERILIQGLAGMASGLFATLLFGTILEQIGVYVGGTVGNYMMVIAAIAKTLTGAGIGVAVAAKLNSSMLVCASASVVGMTGAYASYIINGTMAGGGIFTLGLPGEPLGAFVAAYVAVEIGGLVSGKTKIDIILTPVITIGFGAAAGILVGRPIAVFMTKVGEMINWGVDKQPLVMGVVVSVLMGMALTLPISSAAIGISLKLSGLAAGAAVVGCCANMIGFAVASYKDNKLGGTIAQAIGTSMVQMPNIIKKPIIWLPAIISSAVLGPVSTCILDMTCNSKGAGMGTCGLVGQFMAYETMVAQGQSSGMVVAKIIIVHLVLPGIISFLVAEYMRKKGWINKGDMKIEV